MHIYIYACVISDFHREVDENCALLWYYTASSGNYLQTFRDNIYGTRNVGKDLTLLAT